MKLLIGAALALSLGFSASAATITVENGISGNSGPNCKFGSAVAPFTTGTLLSGVEYSGSCVGYYSVQLDTVAKTITLTGLEHGNYDYGILTISGITEEAITGLSTISYTGLFDPDYYGEPQIYGALPVPALSFTSNSIQIVFDTTGGDPLQFTFDGDGGQAVFSYASAAVPEPATWAFMVAGFGLLGAALRRRSAVFA